MGEVGARTRQRPPAGGLQAGAGFGSGRSAARGGDDRVVHVEDVLERRRYGLLTGRDLAVACAAQMALHGGEGAAEALGDRLEALVRVRGAEPNDLVVVDLTVRRRDAGKGVEVVRVDGDLETRHDSVPKDVAIVAP